MNTLDIGNNSLIFFLQYFVVVSFAIWHDTY